MYFAIGWPKILDTLCFGDQIIRKICCDRVKILTAILTDDTLAIWYTKVCESDWCVGTTRARRRRIASLRPHDICLHGNLFTHTQIIIIIMFFFCSLVYRLCHRGGRVSRLRNTVQMYWSNGNLTRICWWLP